MSGRLEMLNTMTLATSPVKILTATPNVTTGQTQPQVGGQLAVYAFGQVGVDLLLVDGQGVLAGVDFGLPGHSCLLLKG